MLGFKEYLDEEQLDEIKLRTVGKIIKHSPKIVSAAVGAAVAMHGAEAPKTVDHKPATVKTVNKVHK